jgi:hypothetical protein
VGKGKKLPKNEVAQDLPILSQFTSGFRRPTYAPSTLGSPRSLIQNQTDRRQFDALSSWGSRRNQNADDDGAVLVGDDVGAGEDVSHVRVDVADSVTAK